MYANSLSYTDMCIRINTDPLTLQVDVSTAVVSTITGTGIQGKDKEGGEMGIKQEISSPWDIEKGKSPDSVSIDLLFIAMAGTHQIWVHFLKDAKWTKGRYICYGI